MSEESSSLVPAVAVFIGAVSGLEIDPAEVDASAPLFESGQPALAGCPLDSLAIVEVLVALEQELAIEIMGKAEDSDLRSIATISAFVVRAADRKAIVRFEQRWASAPSRG